MLKKRSSKEIFIETFLELAKTNPVDKITIRMIVENSGLSSKTFYNHFQNRQDLMLYVEQSETNQMYHMLENESLSFHDFLIKGISFYSEIVFFLINAFDNTSGTDSFERIHEEQAYHAILGYVLRLNKIEELDDYMKAVLRLYVYGLVEMFYRFAIKEIKMSKDEFVDFCEENMPQKLKPLLLKEAGEEYS